MMVAVAVNDFKMLRVTVSLKTGALSQQYVQIRMVNGIAMFQCNAINHTYLYTLFKRLALIFIFRKILQKKTELTKSGQIFIRKNERVKDLFSK